MAKEFEVKAFSGDIAARYLEQIADLRIRIFRDYPYLYDGNTEYEKQYLGRYFNAADAVIFALFYGDRIIGATTCLPLSQEASHIRKPFEEAQLNTRKYFYFGESLLERIYRGQGFGRLFFEYREKEALKHPEIKYACFCAVKRPPDHPMMPSGYKPLDGFWEKLGYKKQPHLTTYMNWKDVDQQAETPKALEFWVRKIR